MLDEPRTTNEVVPLAYGPADAAKATGRSRTRIYRALRAQELTGRKDGKATLIERTELQRWIASLPTIGRDPNERERKLAPE